MLATKNLPLALLLLVLGVGCQQAPTVVPMDLLIRDALIVDGSGAPGYRGDVIVDGGLILDVGKFDPERVPARRVIKARGKVLAPGFIDAHAHGDPTRTPEFENSLAMGVTTICLGQDGESPGEADIAHWMRRVDALRPGVNIALFVGHGTVRQLSGARYRPRPTEAELERMVWFVDQAMAAGCFGLSTGLEYDAGRPAGAAELAALARPVAERGGMVMSHLRSEDDGEIDAALEEPFAQCRTAGCAAHVSHLKIVHGRGAARAEALLARMQHARDEGLAVSADLYPYCASYTGIGILYPEWAHPPHDFAAVVAARGEELATFLRERVMRRGGPGATLFGSGPCAGRTLEEVAAEKGKPFERVLIEDFPPGSVSAAYFVMDAAVMERFLVDPHVMLCTDGSPAMHHPRAYGAFARVLGEYVRERGLLTLEAAVHKMSALPAETLGLRDRGLIKPGMAADLVLFDPARVRALATYEEPHRLAEGFDLVVVNGAIAREEGALASRRAGRVLRRH